MRGRQPLIISGCHTEDDQSRLYFLNKSRGVEQDMPIIRQQKHVDRLVLVRSIEPADRIQIQSKREQRPEISPGEQKNTSVRAYR